MARREDIETSIWSDPDFQALPGPARAVYIWSFTNQRCGMAGIYKVSPAAISLETGFDAKQLDRALAALQAERFLFYDGRVMFVRTRVKRLRTKSPSIAKSIRSDLDLVGRHPFVRMWWDENEHHDWLIGIERPVFTEDPDTPSRPPRDPLGGSQGTGTGQGTGIEESGGVGEETPAVRNRRVDQTVPPIDMPSDLQPRVDEVLPILQSCWEARGGPLGGGLPPQPRGVGLAIMRNPTVDHAGVARKLVHWLTAGKGQRARCADIAARFGDWVADELPGRPVSLASRQTSGRFSEYDRAAGL